MTKKAAPGQFDLLEWTPPETTARFDEAQVRAASFEARLSRAVAAVLHDCERSRSDVAADMSRFLGREITVNVLNAYASQARQKHVISVERLVALMHATRDRRVLQMIAEMFGWAVIEQRFLPLIELAALRDRQDELKRTADALTRKARSGGAL